MSSRRPAVTPRWETPLPATVTGSWGPDVALWAQRELGITLDRWQRVAINRALAVDRHDRLVHRTYLISTGRQNGKTAIVRSLIGWALTAGELPEWSTIYGLAHDRAQARIPYTAVLADLAPIKRRYPHGGLALTRYLGIRSDLYGRHREYHVGSKESRNAIRGASIDFGLFDELRTQVNYETWAAFEPTTTARPEPLILGTSTAGDERSVLLRDFWERGRRIIDGAEPFAGFGMTWYAADDDDAPDDPAGWRKANPALAEGRLPLEAIRASLYTLSPAMFRGERLNLWTEGVDELLPPGVWRRQTAPAPSGAIRIVLGAEAQSTWRRATVTVAVVTDAGAWFGIAGEIDSSTTGRNSIAPRELVDLVDRLAKQWRPGELAYSKAAAAAPHLAEWCTTSKVRDVPLGARETRSASQLWRSELIGGRLWHSDDALLSQQVRAARPSEPIDQDWYLSLRQSTGEIDAIRAAAWASWAAIAPEEHMPRPRIL